MNDSDTHPVHDATAELKRLKTELAERDATLAQRTTELAQLRTRHALESQLRDAGSIDIGTAITLAEQTLANKTAPDVADAEQAVSDLQRMRPWLFRARPESALPTTGVQSPVSEQTPARRTARLQDAAVDASVTGSRIDLLRYLRLRRKR